MVPTDDRIAIEHVSFVKTLIINSSAGGIQAEHWTCEGGWNIHLWRASGVIELTHDLNGHHMLVGPSQWQSVWVKDAGTSFEPEPKASEDQAPPPDHDPKVQKRMTPKQKLDAEMRLARIRSGDDLP
jgi:hypothetical protein